MARPKSEYGPTTIVRIRYSVLELIEEHREWMQDQRGEPITKVTAVHDLLIRGIRAAKKAYKK